jgi:hypothetical protein
VCLDEASLEFVASLAEQFVVVGLHTSRHQQVDSDVGVGGKLEGRGLRQSVHRVLAGDVDACSWEADEATALPMLTIRP